MNKPTVHFKKPAALVGDVGGIAFVHTIDHPTCSNTGHVRTSRIVSKVDDNHFETLNTIYEGVDHA